jgi:hypothetical protein
MVTVRPPTATSNVRDCPVLFCGTVILRVVLPLPLIGDTVRPDAWTVKGQPVAGTVVSVTFRLPPVAGAVHAAGLTA